MPVKRKRTGLGKVDPKKGLSAADIRAQSKIKFPGDGDPTGKLERKVRKTLATAFTQAEVRSMGNVVVGFGKVPYDNRAVMYGKTENHSDTTEIVYSDKGFDEDDVTHEFVHVLKDVDSSRKGYAAAGNPRQRQLNRSRRGDIRNAEEATVVAEAAIRTEKPIKKVSGYYDEVPGVGRSKSRMRKAYLEDRKTLLEEPGRFGKRRTRGVQGKAAVAKVNKNFANTNIAQKKRSGRSAMRSYELLRGK